jgi:hypothetical protein
LDDAARVDDDLDDDLDDEARVDDAPERARAGAPVARVAVGREPERADVPRGEGVRAAMMRSTLAAASVIAGQARRGRTSGAVGPADDAARMHPGALRPRRPPGA